LEVVQTQMLLESTVKVAISGTGWSGKLH